MKRIICLIALLNIVWGCNAAREITSPSPVQAVVAAATSSTPAPPVVEPPPAVTPGPPVAVSNPANPNCTELDPKKWVGFTYRVHLTFVQIWNASDCDRVSSWRPFNVVSDTNQPPLGDAVFATVPAGKMDFRIDLHFYPLGCGRTHTVQTDGRAGIVPNMTHANASFPPGVLFTLVTPPCAPPSTFVSEIEIPAGPTIGAQTFVCTVTRRFRITETNGCTTRTREEDRIFACES
jgi:hypothetical protein